MIDFTKYTLPNGLRIVVHVDNSTPLAAVNLLYNVGAKDEREDQTGFAHLFEHLMFGGSKHIPSYDEPLQMAGGDNNAFTSNDITNYYQTVPANNLETAFWLESDRMLELDFSQSSLDVQKNVVIEEFKQRYLNQPYGDLPLLYRPLAYKVHPYRWPTIGMTTSHIEEATLEDVKSFFYSHYAPNNAILTVTGNVVPEEVYNLAQKWFGSIPARNVPVRNLPVEPVQNEHRILEVQRNVPSHHLLMAFHMCSRTDSGFHAADLLSDILSNGASSRLNQNLVKKTQLFTEINAYISGDDEPGLFIVTGRINPGVSFAEAEAAVWHELTAMAESSVEDYELQKVKNKVEANLIYSEVSFLNKAMSLAHFELQGDAGTINEEPLKYRNVTPSSIQKAAAKIFQKNNCNTVRYFSQNAPSN